MQSKSRPLFFALGVICVGLGYIGYVVPGMPGTVFFICALWAFKRSSPKLEDWLLNKSFIGPTLKDWEHDKSIRKGTKVLIIFMLWSSILLSCALIWPRPTHVWLVPILLTVAVGVSIYILTRKTKVEA